MRSALRFLAVPATALLATACTAPTSAPQEGEAEAMETAQSFYPPGYVISTECRTDGPVEICALNRGSGVPQLRIRYAGYLLAEQWGRISAWVRLNGREGTFRLENRDFAEWANLGALRDVKLCAIPDSTGVNPTAPQYPVCTDRDPVPGGSVTWTSKPAPEAEQALFFYARNQFGLANDWDVEVAFVSDDGRWDSRFGANYRVSIR
jgi:hypothetical protein